MDAFCEIPEFDAEVVPAPTEGFVYFGGSLAEVKAVSLVPDPSLDVRFDRITVALDDALAFLDGRRTMDGWHVGFAEDRKTRSLVPTLPDRVVLRSFIDDRPTEIPHGLVFGPLAINATINPNTGVFTLRCDGVVKISCDVETLPFWIVDRNDPTRLIHRFTVPVGEFLATGKATVELGHPVFGDASVLTQRVCEYYGFGIDTGDRGIPLPPGKLLPLSPVPRVSPDAVADPCFLIEVDRTSGRLRFSLHEDGGEYYKRNCRFLYVTVCRPGDPTAIHAACVIERSELEQWTHLDYPLAGPWLEDDFDVYVSTYYLNTVRIDHAA